MTMLGDARKASAYLQSLGLRTKVSTADSGRAVYIHVYDNHSKDEAEDRDYKVGTIRFRSDGTIRCSNSELGELLR
jgi:hypothetical protein